MFSRLEKYSANLIGPLILRPVQATVILLVKMIQLLTSTNQYKEDVIDFLITEYEYSSPGV